MKWPTSRLVLATIVFSLACQAYAADSIEWQTDLEAAFEQARAENRPLLVHFWTPECVPCRRLEQNVFNQPRVANTVNRFIPVKVDASAYPAIAAKYRISSVPKDVILTPNDEELHRLFTPQDPEQYVAQLSAVAFRSGNQTVASRGRAELPPPTGTSGRTGAAQDSTASALPPRGPATTPEEFLSRHRGGSDVAAEERPTEQASSAVSEPTEVINRFARRPGAQPGNSAATTAGSPEPGRAGNGRSRWGTWPEDGELGRAERVENTTAANQPPPRETVEPDSPNSRAASRQSRWSDAETAQPEPAAVATDVAAGSAAAPAMAAATPRPRDTAPRRNQAAPAPLGMDGYCPVTLLTQEKWVQGNPKHGVIHRGRLYLFVSEAEKNTFFSNPDEFSPVLAGIDPVELTDGGEPIEGNRAHGVVYRKRVYLFSSEKNLERFWEDPERYASPIRQAMETGNLEGLFR